MKMYLNRTRTRQATTDGVLFAENGLRICDTAEYTPKRLPSGTYKVVMGRKGIRAPFLVSGLKFQDSGFILRGNGVYAKDFGSTIIVGEHLLPGVVINSQKYFGKLMKRLEKVFERGGEVELTIR